MTTCRNKSLISANSLARLVLPVALAALIAGCSTTNRGVEEWKQVAISDFPRENRTYLVIGARFLPGDRPQPTWIVMAQTLGTAYLPLIQSAFEVDPMQSKVYYINFPERPMPGFSNRITLKHNTTNSPNFDLEPGHVYFYGMIEIDNTGQRIRLRTVRDLDLLRRACDESPAIFEVFELKPIGPVAREGSDLPTCEELLSQPG